MFYYPRRNLRYAHRGNTTQCYSYNEQVNVNSIRTYL